MDFKTLKKFSDKAFKGAVVSDLGIKWSRPSYHERHYAFRSDVPFLLIGENRHKLVRIGTVEVDGQVHVAWKTKNKEMAKIAYFLISEKKAIMWLPGNLKTGAIFKNIKNEILWEGKQ